MKAEIQRFAEKGFYYNGSAPIFVGDTFSKMWNSKFSWLGDLESLAPCNGDMINIIEKQMKILGRPNRSR